MGIFYVESPGQIISAFECIGEHSNGNSLYIRLNGNEYNDTQIKNTVSFYLDKIDIKVTYIESNLDFIKYVLSKKIISNGDLYLGCHKSKYTRLLNFLGCKYTLLDDGIASYIYVQNGGKKPIFTCLDIEPNVGQVVKNHKFEVLKRMVKNKKEFSSVQIFFGAKYVECGIVDISEYVKILRTVIESNKNVLYVAHRAESDENLALYQDLGMSVIRWNYPSEIALVISKDVIDRVYGLYSAALVTTKILLPDVEVNIFYSCVLNIEQDEKQKVYNVVTKYADYIF